MCKLHVSDSFESNKEPRQIKYVFQSNRRSTDRYWISLFVVIFIVWIASWLYLKNNAPELCNNADCKIVPYNSTITKIINTIHVFVSRHWIYDIIMCNIRFLDSYYHTRGSFLIWVYALFCIGFIYYSLASMRSDYIFCNQITEFGKIFISHLFYYRVSMFILNDLDLIKIFSIHYDKKIAIWVMPELIFITIWAAKKTSKNSNSGPPEKINYFEFKRHTVEAGAILVLILEILIFLTAVDVFELRCSNLLFFAVVGGSCYVGLTLFYYGLMVRACATSIALNDTVDSQKTTHVLRALYVVGRYHFGTACYHATLIFPRIHAACVINEIEFRKTPNFPVAYRFYVMYFKLYKVSTIVTAVLGENHSTALRELLRSFTGDSYKPYQGFNDVCVRFFTLMLSANSAMLILFWSQGAIIDPRFPMGTWWMIFIVMFLTYLYMRVDDAVLDTILFNVNDENIVEF